MPALESSPWWESQLSKAWSAVHCIVLEGAFRVIRGKVALELLGVHAAYLEAGAPAGVLALVPAAVGPQVNCLPSLSLNSFISEIG